MKTFKYIIGILGIAALGPCSDFMDYHEYKVDDADYIKEMFSRVGGFTTTIYQQLDQDFGNYSGALLSSATDESVYSHSGNEIEDFYNGAWSPSNAKGSIWSSCYKGISYCNLLLDEFQGLTFPDYQLDVDYQKEMYQYQNYQWEARWARAYFYFLLVRQYGDVPLKVNHMDAETANNLPRTPYEEIFKFIDDECVAIKDTIIKDYNSLGNMALSQTENGRANNLAVLALRARAALYHASPLFNPNNDRELWHQAALRCQECINACKARGMNLVSDYMSLFQSDNYKDTKEIIFLRRQNTTSTNNNFEKYNFPRGLDDNAGGGNCPTQNLVDAFEMTNGKAITDNESGYDPQQPYVNRDKRLSWIVAVNGEQWPNANPGPLKIYYGGQHGLPTTYATPTGYYLKKYCNPSTVISATGANSFYHNWVIFRLAEIYLDLAEAMLNYTGSGYETADGLNMSAAQAINVVRARAGQPNIATGLSADEFKKRYENERFVELAFEGHRFFDLRRWKKAPEYLTTIRKMDITMDADSVMHYTPGELETRQWSDKMYLFPIPQSEIQKAGNLTQNAGW
jgi:hypothetical protein